MPHFAVIFLIVATLLATGCLEESPPPRLSEQPAPRETGFKGQRIGEASKTLEPGREIHFQPSDFAQHGEARLIEVRPSLRVHRRRGSAQEQQALVERLQAHAPWPYILKEQRDIPRGMKPWGKIRATYQARLSLRKPRKAASPLGTLYFKFELESSKLPAGYQMNWDAVDIELKHNRNFTEYQELKPSVRAQITQKTDEELDALIRQQLPSLVIQSEAELDELIELLGLRRSLKEGKLHAITHDPLTGLHAGGCFTARKGEAERLYWMISTPRAIETFEEVHPSRHIHCLEEAIIIAEPETNRLVEVRYKSWDETRESWRAVARFDRDIDPKTLQFHLGPRTVCLTGEQRDQHTRYARLSCFDRSNGAPRWSWDAPGTDFAGVVVRGDELIIAIGSHVRIFNIDSGAALWSARIPGATGLTGQNRGCLTESGLFIFSPSLGHYVALNIEQREAPWEVTTFGQGLLICDQQGGIYFDEAGNTLLSLQLAGVLPRWRFGLTHEINDALYHSEHLLLLAPWALYVLNARTGELRGQLPLPVRGQRLVRHHRNIYLVDEGGVYVLTQAGDL